MALLQIAHSHQFNACWPRTLNRPLALPLLSLCFTVLPLHTELHTWYEKPVHVRPFIRHHNSFGITQTRTRTVAARPSSFNILLLKK